MEDFNLMRGLVLKLVGLLGQGRAADLGMFKVRSVRF
jgi:hypothetical protein